MRFGEVIHHMGQARELPTWGALVGLPAIAIGLLSDVEGGKWMGMGGVVLVFVTHLLKLAIELNKTASSFRKHNADQDQRIEDHEERLRKLEARHG